MVRYMRSTRCDEQAKIRRTDVRSHGKSPRKTSTIPERKK
jgi:hypothetical protein